MVSAGGAGDARALAAISDRPAAAKSWRFEREEESGMDTLLADRWKLGFGPDPLLPSPPPLRLLDGPSGPRLREAVRQAAPPSPGVYGMLDANGRLFYVGKAKRLRHRLLSYFLPGNADEKAGRIIQTARCIVLEEQPSEFAALLREQRLIGQLQPRMNVQGIPKRQRAAYICLGRPKAEMLYVSRQPDANAIRCEGPFLGAGRLRRGIETLNRHFQLRDCSSRLRLGFSDQLPLLVLPQRAACLRLELGTCLGPCVEATSRATYREQVRQAERFLAGSVQPVIDHLREAMLEAAHRQHYERAACLREDLSTLSWLGRRLTDHAHARREFSFLYPVRGADQQVIWYLILNGMVLGSWAAPRSQSEYRRCKQKAMELTAAGRAAAELAVTSPERRSLAIVCGWFRKHPHELKQTLSLDSLPNRLPASATFPN
jgi:excinuclease ABC subunit C